MADGARVLHVDLDQFIAAVEVLRRPELTGRPVVVGGRGDPTERGVVATASYEARAFGVGSGMPLRLAARKCPDAVFLPADAAAYDAASVAVMETLRTLRWGGPPVLLEVLGWDEAFLGPAPGHGALVDSVEYAQAVRDQVLATTRLHCCVGVSDNKLQAKLATGFAKPPDGVGVYRISDRTWYHEMGGRPTRALWGIGAKTAARLSGVGIETVEQLARADPAALAVEFGPTTGPWLRRLGRAVDTSPVDPSPWVPRGHGREETFQADLTDWGEVRASVDRIARRVVEDIAKQGRPAFRVQIKVRLRPFFTLTRSHKLASPTSDPDTLAAEAVALLDRIDDQRPVRLLGVRLDMVPPEGGY